MNPSKPDENNEKGEDPKWMGDLIIIIDESPGDTTIRPSGPGIYKEYPRPQLPPKEPPSPDKP